jgi:hypothetical protein
VVYRWFPLRGRYSNWRSPQSIPALAPLHKAQRLLCAGQLVRHVTQLPHRCLDPFPGLRRREVGSIQSPLGLTWAILRAPFPVRFTFVHNQNRKCSPFDSENYDVVNDPCRADSCHGPQMRIGRAITSKKSYPTAEHSLIANIVSSKLSYCVTEGRPQRGSFAQDEATIELEAAIEEMDPKNPDQRGRRAAVTAS